MSVTGERSVRICHSTSPWRRESLREQNIICHEPQRLRNCPGGGTYRFKVPLRRSRTSDEGVKWRCCTGPFARYMRVHLPVCKSTQRQVPSSLLVNNSVIFAVWVPRRSLPAVATPVTEAVCPGKVRRRRWVMRSISNTGPDCRITCGHRAVSVHHASTNTHALRQHTCEPQYIRPP